MRVLPPGSLQIRPREAGDDPFIVELSTQAFAEYASRAGMNTLRMAQRFITLVACRDGMRVGFASIEILSSGTAALQAIAVREAYRGRGMGRRLLAEAERVAAAHGARKLTLHTAQANVAAFELFAKNGYRIERRLRRYYRNVFDACWMSKRLRSGG